MAFTPISPHSAIFHAIYTCMKNSQDVLQQRNQRCGALWRDEGVYHVAKELQLLKPTELGNIFIGLGGFHLEKVLLGVVGQFLEKIGVRDIFVQNEIYTPAITDNKVVVTTFYQGKGWLII